MRLCIHLHQDLPRVPVRGGDILPADDPHLGGVGGGEGAGGGARDGHAALCQKKKPNL